MLVHGDTFTTLAARPGRDVLRGAKVGHEAGLRTNNKWAPFPFEEMNRRLTGYDRRPPRPHLQRGQPAARRLFCRRHPSPATP